MNYDYNYWLGNVIEIKINYCNSTTITFLITLEKKITLKYNNYLHVSIRLQENQFFKILNLTVLHEVFVG